MEDQSGCTQVLLELLACDACLDRGVEIVRADTQDAVHPRHVDRDPAVDRVDVALERGAGAERDDRTTMCRAGENDRLDGVGTLGEHDGVR